MKDSSDLPIEEYDPVHRSLVDDFWRRLLGRAWNDRARSRWEWLNARRRHFLIRDGDRLLGNATLLRQDFVDPDGIPMPMGWITDFYVSPELKGRGMGKRLTRRLMEECPNLATFGQSQEARHCFSSLGWSGPDWVPLLSRLTPPWAPGVEPRLTFRQVRLDDPALEEIWVNRVNQEPFQSDRSPAALRTRLAGRPDATYEIWLGEDDGRAMGFVILRFIREWRNRRFGCFPVTLMVDAAATETSGLSDLVGAAVRRSSRRGSLAMLAVEPWGPVGEVLHRSGFRADLGLGPLKVLHLPRKGFMVSPTAAPELRFPLLLSFLDCDAELTF